MVAILRRRTPADELLARVAQVRAKQPVEDLAVEDPAEIVAGALVFVAPDRRRLVLITSEQRVAYEAARAHAPATVQRAPDGTYIVVELLGDPASRR